MIQHTLGFADFRHEALDTVVLPFSGQKTTQNINRMQPVATPTP